MVFLRHPYAQTQCRCGCVSLIFQHSPADLLVLSPAQVVRKWHKHKSEALGQHTLCLVYSWGKVRWKKGTTEASKIAHVISIGPHPKKVTNLSREDNQKIGRNCNETWTAWSFFFGKTQVYLYRSGTTHRLGSIVSDSVRLFKDTACAQQHLYCIYFGEAERLHSDGKEVAERNCSAASL